MAGGKRRPLFCEGKSEVIDRAIELKETRTKAEKSVTTEIGLAGTFEQEVDEDVTRSKKKK